MQFLRVRRHNSGFLEELGPNTLEKECVEEQCTVEEHNEIFKSDESIPEETKTPEFLNEQWQNYTNTYLRKCWSEPCSGEGTALCINRFNSRECICKDGFKGADCEEDIDECAENEETEAKCQSENTVCQNTIGSFKCACLPGYRK